MARMFGRRALRGGVVFLVLAPVGLLASPAPASAAPVSSVVDTPAVSPAVPSALAVPGLAPAGSRTSGVFGSWGGAEVYTSGDEATAQLIGCRPDTGIDNPHRSSTGVAASGHGWWNKGTCSNDRARVVACIYEYYTDGTWRQKACGSNDSLKPGGGSSNRVTARRDCDSTTLTSWRNHVDVDVNGEVDDGNVEMRQADINCRVN